MDLSQFNIGIMVLPVMEFQDQVYKIKNVNCYPRTWCNQNESGLLRLTRLFPSSKICVMRGPSVLSARSILSHLDNHAAWAGDTATNWLSSEFNRVVFSLFLTVNIFSVRWCQRNVFVIRHSVTLDDEIQKNLEF